MRGDRRYFIAFLLALAVVVGIAVWWTAPAWAQPAATVYTFPSQPPIDLALWPPATFSIVPMIQPRWREAVADAYGHLGPGVDVGCVRRTAAGTFEVAMNGQWQPLNVRDYAMVAAVRAFARWGSGWSYAGHADPHAQGQDYYLELARLLPECPPILRMHLPGLPPGARCPELVRANLTPVGIRPLDDVSYDASFYGAVLAAKAQYLDPAPGPTPVPTATPAPCRAPCSMRFGVCVCPEPTPAPTPRPTPTPTVTPVPTPPCEPVQRCACEPAPKPAIVEEALRAVPEKGIRRITWALRGQVDRALAAWLAFEPTRCSTGCNDTALCPGGGK